MISIDGFYYDGTSSTKTSAHLRLDDVQNVVFTLEGGTKTFSFSELSISPRVGNTPRVVYLPSGERFETNDNANVDQLIKTVKGDSFYSAYSFESNVKLIALSVVFFVGVSLALLKWGVPVASNYLAYQLPVSFSHELSAGVLDRLDDFAFTKSELDQPTQAQIKSLFNEVVPSHSPFNFNIQFRKSEKIGANAFALPDGTVVVTDEIVALMGDPLELQSVLYHEVGHVLSRHSLRNVIESLGVGVVLSLMFGDVNATSEVILTLPYVIVQTSYSRDKEREADNYALEHMLAENKDPVHFANMMKKLQQSAIEKNKPSEDSSVEKPSENHTQNNEETENPDSRYEILDYFSTHPATSERIEKFEKASAEAGY